MKKALLAIVLAASFGYASGSITDSVFVIDPVVITATRTERDLREVPARVDVISSAEIENTPAEKIDDILRSVSGVNANRSSGITTMRPSVTVRGLSGDEQGRTLVLVDGIPINTSDEGGVNWNMLSASGIRHIEIFKGPGSSLYGNNAMGGVINILTRDYSRPFEADASVSYGTFGTWNTSLAVSGAVSEKISLFADAFFNESDGYNNIPEADRPDPDYTVDRFVKEGGVNAKAAFRLDSMFNFDLSYSLFLDKRGEGEKIEAPDGEYRNFNTNRISARIFGKGAKGFSYSLSAFYQREDYFKLDERLQRGAYQRFDVRSDRDDMGVLASAVLKPGRSNTLTLGGEAKTGKVRGGDYYVTSPDVAYNEGNMRFLSLYVQDEAALAGDKLFLQLGLRYDNARFHDGFFDASGANVGDFAISNGRMDDHEWSNFSPRAALRYNPSEMFGAYVSYSRGFRSSILDDLCRSGWMWVGPKVANPELGPETLDNYEIGFDLRPTERLLFYSSLYYSRGKDFLYYVATGDKLWGTRDIYRRENVTEVDIYGAEADLKYEISKNLSLGAGYSFSRSKIGKFAERPELEGKYLTYVPKHQVKGSLLWTNRIVDAHFLVYTKSEQYSTDDNSGTLDGFATCDVMLSRRFLDNRLKVSLSVMDIFDNEHMNTKDYISPGRLVTLKLAASIF